MLPAARSPWWGLVFVVLALVLAVGVIGIGTIRRDLPPAETMASIAGVTAGIAAVLTLLGSRGARAAFVGGVVGHLVGLGLMLRVGLTSTDGMADLAALLMFLLLGGVGAVLGGIVDVVRLVRRGRRTG